MTDAVHCDSIRTYGFGVLQVGPDVPRTYLYDIDFETQTVSTICSFPFDINGAASSTEFIASDCRVNIDLDDDNSSGPPGKDYAAVFCASGGLSGPAADTSDAVFYSGYPVDSLVLRLLPALPDGAWEYLTMQAPGLLGLSGQATQTLRLTPVAASALPLTPLNGAYQTALRSLQYHNDAPTPTPGPRTVEVVAYALGGRSDTAYAYIELAAPVWVYQTETLCAGQSYMWQGAALSADTSFCVTLSNALGCDSTYCLELTFLYPEVSLDTVLCAGQTLLWQGLQYATPGTYQDTLLLNGCQIAATIQLQIAPPDTLALSETICAGATYALHGQTFAASGLYAVGFTDPQGCDAVSLLNLTVAPPDTLALSETICAGATYALHGQTFAASGLYAVGFTDPQGCNAVSLLNLTVAPPDTLALSETICAGATYALHGQTFAASGLYAVGFTDPQGCNAVSLLNLTVAPPDTLALSETICAGATYALHGQTFAASGLYAVGFTDPQGCDAVSLLNLTVAPPDTLALSETICAGATYALHGQTFAASGLYAVGFTDPQGCNAVSLLNLTVAPPDTLALSETICAGATYALHGQTFAASGLYAVGFTDPQGCNAVSLLNLTVAPPDTLALSETICAGATYALHGQTFAASGLYAVGFTDPQGCNAVALLNLTVAPPDTLALSETICAGATYALHGQTFAASGLYAVGFTDPQGCNAVSLLNLTVAPPDTLALSETICAGATYALHGQTFAASGLYAVGFTDPQGCNAVSLLNLTVAPPDTLALSETICAGATYALHGQTFAASGLYAVGFTDPQGCNAVSLLSLTVSEAPVQPLSAAICPGDTYDFYGQTLNAPGNYVFVDMAGACDTLRALTLALLPGPQPQISGPAAVCDGETAVLTVTGGAFAQAVWSGGQAGTSVSVTGGAYAVTVTNPEGCTATAAYLLESLTAPAADWAIQSPRCAGERNGALGVSHASGGLPPYAYVLNTGAVSLDGMFAGLMAGTYAITMQDAAGCESVFELTLSDPPALSAALDAPPLLPPGGSYRLTPQITPAGIQLTYAWSPQEGLSCADCPDPVARPTAPTTYTLTVTDANGCRATASVWVNVLPPDPQLYAPNAFLPQSLPGNEGFTLFGDPNVFVRIELLQVYDRWGNLLWEGRDLGVGMPNEGWDGRARGRMMPPGVYVWYAEARRADGELVRRSGDVTLLR